MGAATKFNVSILVVMEVGEEASIPKGNFLSQNSFNPCCNGSG